VLISDPELNQFGKYLNRFYRTLEPTSFSGTTLAGSITNAGPFDAKISFPQGLIVSWAGSPLGSLNLPDVDVVGDIGAQINAESTFAVADVAHLTDFTKVRADYSLKTTPVNSACFHRRCLPRRNLSGIFRQRTLQASSANAIFGT
jgi:hypothetical protein